MKKAKIEDNPYYGDFVNSQVGLIKSRIKLFCILAVVIYLLASAISMAMLPEEFNPSETSVIIVLVISSLLIRFSIARVHSIRTAKFHAYLFTMVVLVLLTKASMLYPKDYNLSEATYLFCLFLVSFTVPWKPIEILPITLMHTTAFIFLFYYVRGEASYSVDISSLYSGEFFPMVGGLIFLTMGFILCFVIRKNEFLRDLENYVLLKEVEKRNIQMQKELQLATKVHKTLIPKSIYTDLVDVAVMYLPMYYIGGDYAKFHFKNNDKLILMICDVTGHGVSAALLVNRVHSEFERLAKDDKSPGELLKELNDFITNDFKEIEMYLSAFSCEVDFKNMKFKYSNHGHPSQYIYRINKSLIEHMDPQAGLLGLPFLENDVVEHEINVSKGDKIVLFTDGVIETKNKIGVEFGKKKLEDFVAETHLSGVDEFNNKLLAEINEYNAENFNDDIFVLSMDIK